MPSILDYWRVDRRLAALACNGIAGLAQRKPFQPQLVCVHRSSPLDELALTLLAINATIRTHVKSQRLAGACSPLTSFVALLARAPFLPKSAPVSTLRMTFVAPSPICLWERAGVRVKYYEILR